MNVPIGDEKNTIEKDQSSLEMVVYRDTWGKGIDSYLYMMYERLALIKELLSTNGNVWSQCAQRVAAFLRLVMDDIYGREQFQGIISWRGTYAGKTVGRKIPSNVDNILWFSESSSFKLKPMYKELSDQDIAQYNKDDNDGRGKYTTVAMQKVSGPFGTVPELLFEKKGLVPALQQLLIPC